MTPFTQEAGRRELRARRKGLESWSGEAGGQLHDQRLSNRQRGSDLGPQMDSSRARGTRRLKVRDRFPCSALHHAEYGLDLRKDFQVMSAQ